MAIVTNPLNVDKYYHIYNCGINGENLFHDEENYYYFLRLYHKYINPIIHIDIVTKSLTLIDEVESFEVFIFCSFHCNECETFLLLLAFQNY